jgi:hypothetical protein
MKSTFARFTLVLAVLLLAAQPTLAFSPVAGRAAHRRSLPRVAGPSGPGLFSISLPLVLMPEPGLQGHVTVNGVPTGGVPLDLRYFNGSSWSSRGTLSTASDGSYRFADVPSLNPGEHYYVRFLNTAETDGRLWLWGTRELDSYTNGAAVALGDFDLADVTLLSPDAGALVSLPFTFRWTRRPATPSDSYEFDLWDWDDDDPFFYTDPPLGYVDSFTLNNTPPGFATYTPYTWDIWIYSPDGGYGICFWSFYVGFSNTGQLAASPAPALTAASPHRTDDLPPRPATR